MFLESAERLILEVENLETLIGAKHAPLKGPLRVSAPSDLGRSYVAPMLVDFVATHPDIHPELYLGDDISDLVASATDIAIRYGKLEDSALISRPLLPNGRVLVASPGYLAAHGTPAHPRDLASHRCLALVRNGEKLPWTMTIDGKRQTVRTDPVLSTNDGDMLRAWAIAGQGIVFKSYVDVAADLRAGRLEPILQPFMAGNVGLHLIFPAARSSVPRIRAFINFALARFRALSTELTQD